MELHLLLKACLAPLRDFRSKKKKSSLCALWKAPHLGFVVLGEWGAVFLWFLFFPYGNFWKVILCDTEPHQSIPTCRHAASLECYQYNLFHEEMLPWKVCFPIELPILSHTNSIKKSKSNLKYPKPFFPQKNYFLFIFVRRRHLLRCVFNTNVSPNKYKKNTKEFFFLFIHSH